MSLRTAKHQFTPNEHQFGFSLIELMIAMVLGLTIVAAVATLSLNATRSYRVMNQAGELIENGRYAIRVLKDDLKHAGYYGLFIPTNTNVVSQELTDPCDKPDSNLEPSPPSPSELEKSFLLPVVGYTSTPGSCVSPDTGTQVLVIRRADIIEKEPEASKVFLQTSPDKYVIGKLGKLGNPSLFAPSVKTSFDLQNAGGIATSRLYHVTIYYVSKGTLMRRVTTNGNPVSQPIVDGIETIQYQYGLDCGATPGTANDGAPDAFLSTYSMEGLANQKIQCPVNLEPAWEHVVAVRVNILARSQETDGNYIDKKSYDLNPDDGTEGEISPKNDNYHRRVFSQVVRLINVSGRRE